MSNAEVLALQIDDAEVDLRYSDGKSRPMSKVEKDMVIAHLRMHKRPSPQPESAAHPYLQMAAGNHHIGVFKDGKMIASDAEVLMPPDSPKEKNGEGVELDLVAIAKEMGAVSYSPPPMRAVRGVSFTYEQLDAFFGTAMARATQASLAAAPVSARADIDVQGLLANVIEHWELVPNDIKSDPGMDDLNSAVRDADEAIGGSTK